MRRVAIVAFLTMLTPANQVQTEENRGSADYVLPLCKMWLDVAEKQEETVQNMGRTEPVRLTSAGVCVGFVVGVLETLRAIKLSCPPKDINNPEIVRTLVNEIEKRPDQMQADFAITVRASMMKLWPCRKKQGLHRVKSISGRRR
jgi:Rap1a immunity proteins